MGGFHSQRTCQVPCFNEFFGLTFGKVCKIPWLMLPQLEWWQWGRPQAFLRTMGSFERAGCPSHCLPVKVCHVWPGSRGALGNLIRAHFRQTVKLGKGLWSGMGCWHHGVSPLSPSLVFLERCTG